jgi:hypothetical protein
VAGPPGRHLARAIRACDVTACGVEPERLVDHVTYRPSANTKRNRLFMAASQSLYALYVATQGAAPA